MLQPGQEILFLSFTRAATRQLLLRCQDILGSKEREHIRIRTYHLFCMETLVSHGRLLCGRQVAFLYPEEERLRKSTFQGDWNAERLRLSTEEGLFCFDLFALAVANLFEQCIAVRQLLAKKYPLVIVDEFQDTDNNQWRIIQNFLKSTDVFCLADPEQRIFEYRRNVDPRRLETLRSENNLKEFDLGGANHRSPKGGILKFADAVLRNQSPLPRVSDVRYVYYYGNEFASKCHAGVIWTLSELRQQGIEKPSVAILCRSNPFVLQLSAILSEHHQFNGRKLPPVEHDVLWDADLSATAAQVVGSILEWPTKEPQSAVYDSLLLITNYYRLKNAASPSKAAVDNARKYNEAAEKIAEKKLPRIKAAKELLRLADKGLEYTGNPVEDWRKALDMLQTVKALNELHRDARMVRLFRVTDVLGSGLANVWMGMGSYNDASNIVKRILDRERLLAAERDSIGCVLMTIHKSKGKEFDGVVLIEGNYMSKFFDESHEQPPYEQSRRLLRVGITRARSRVTIIRPRNALKLVGEYS